MPIPYTKRAGSLNDDKGKARELGRQVVGSPHRLSNSSSCSLSPLPATTNSREPGGGKSRLFPMCMVLEQSS